MRVHRKCDGNKPQAALLHLQKIHRFEQGRQGMYEVLHLTVGVHVLLSWVSLGKLEHKLFIL